MTRFVFITGGVVSSLGKGIASAALGALLQARGYSVRLRKLDPYLNVDPGTMSAVRSTARCSSRTTGRRRIWIWDITSGSPAWRRGSKLDNVTSGKIYSERDRARNGAAIIWAPRCR